MSRIAVAFLLVFCVGCGGGGGAAIVIVAQTAPLILAAGMEQLEPDLFDTWSVGVDTQRLGIGGVETTYDLTTPAGQSFVFEIVSRGESNAGTVRVSCAHAQDGGGAPGGGIETLAAAGVVVSASGTTNRGVWLDARGDGFARVSLSGAIDRDQVVAVEVDDGTSTQTALVRIRIGPASRINLTRQDPGDYPGVVDRVCLYTSDSWLFGLPTVAISGDRATVVTYEGDRADPFAPRRYEMRLQYDHRTGARTGGASSETSPDTGNWRDHEIAALFNVLALVHSGWDVVTLKLSFDRGASFGQLEQFGQLAPGSRARLAQIAMAADYTLAVLFWRTNPDRSSELILVEGRPSALDGGGSPTRFRFDPPRTVFFDHADVTPILMGAQYSEGGDLVVGYAFSRFDFAEDDLTWTSDTQFRCAVRLFGETSFRDTLVDRDLLVGRDPSVALVGSGARMSVLYAYEGRPGVQVVQSDDAGRTWSAPVTVGGRNAHTPAVFARARPQGTRVDVLYLAQGEFGQELHLSTWSDFGRAAREDYRLTEATRVKSDTVPPGPVPGAPPGVAIAPDYGYRVKQIAWFGYDAVLDGDEIVIAYDEQTYDAVTAFGGPGFLDERGGPAALPAAGDFVAAEPPPLAPGLTEPLPDCDPDQMHQLMLLRIA